MFLGQWNHQCRISQDKLKAVLHIIWNISIMIDYKHRPWSFNEIPPTYNILITMYQQYCQSCTAILQQNVCRNVSTLYKHTLQITEAHWSRNFLQISLILNLEWEIHVVHYKAQVTNERMNYPPYWITCTKCAHCYILVADRKHHGSAATWESSRRVPAGFPVADTRRTGSRCSSRRPAGRRTRGRCSRRRCHPPGNDPPCLISSSCRMPFTSWLTGDTRSAPRLHSTHCC